MFNRRPKRIFLQEISQPLLLVKAKTGIEYEQQMGGSKCEYGVEEGFLIVLEDPRDYLDKEERPLYLIEKLLEDKELSVELIRTLTPLIEKIHVFAEDDKFQTLKLDFRRIHLAEEAWIPVTLPGIYDEAWLIWRNSD